MIMGAESQLTFCGRPLDSTPDSFGELKDSSDLIMDVDSLRQSMADDGYLLLRNLLDVDEVQAARREVLTRLAANGNLDSNFDLMEGVANKDAEFSYSPKLAYNNKPLEKVLYHGAMMEFYTRFLGGEVRHYDYTWFRAKTPGSNTATHPHYDIVYMGRGTKNVFTSWTPIGDVHLALGPLMLLENSHKLESLKSTYGKMDVDRYCTNYSDAQQIESGEKTWQSPTGGAYSDNANSVQRKFNSRWLTTNFKAGDVLIFSMVTMHASLDNHTNHVRLSSDSRYQLASEEADERWIGENPIAHGVASKRGMIC